MSRPGTFIRFLLPVVAALLLAGCAAFGGGAANGVDPEGTMRALFAAEPVKGMLRGEAEITFKYFGRGVSLPGVVQLLGPSLFRFDLLDPFDRPAAIIFSDSGPMVQFQPMAMTAAIIDPHPEGCGDVSPGAWVGVVLGEAPRHGRPGNSYRRSWMGRPRLERYTQGMLALRVDYRPEGGGLSPWKVTWYCREDAVLSVEIDEFRTIDGARFPDEFTVRYPMAQLEIEFDLGEMEVVGSNDSTSLFPDLGPSVQWTSWEMVRGE